MSDKEYHQGNNSRKHRKSYQKDCSEASDSLEMTEQRSYADNNGCLTADKAFIVGNGENKAVIACKSPVRSINESSVIAVYRQCTVLRLSYDGISFYRTVKIITDELTVISVILETTDIDEADGF